MNPVRDALDDGVPALVLAVAAHEVAHGIAWRAAGFCPGPVWLRYGLLGGLADGGCEHNARGRVTAGNVDGFLVGLMAGAAGQARCASRHLSGRCARAGSNSADRGEFVHLQCHYRTGLTQGAARRRAESLLSRSGARLDALTVRLARSGRISGGAL